MTDDPGERPDPVAFDAERFAEDTLIYDRREGRDRRDFIPSQAPRQTTPDVATEAPAADATVRPPAERRAKKERRRRIDPTTFEKQYTDDELEFMNAMQRFKVQSGKQFPSFGDVLRVAHGLGYRKLVTDDDSAESDPDFDLDQSDSFELIQPNGSH